MIKELSEVPAMYTFQLMQVTLKNVRFSKNIYGRNR